MLRVVLAQARLEHWRHASLSIGFYVTGALMPVWLSFLLLLLISQPIGYGTYLDNGQFAIYAAAAFSPVLFSLWRQGTGHERIFYALLILICLIIAAGIFSGLTVAESLTLRNLKINVMFLRVSSISVYIVALIATFFVDLHENVYTELDVPEERIHRQAVLERAFDQEMDSGDSGND